MSSTHDERQSWDRRDVPSPGEVYEKIERMVEPLLWWYNPDFEHVRQTLHKTVDEAVDEALARRG